MDEFKKDEILEEEEVEAAVAETAEAEVTEPVGDVEEIAEDAAEEITEEAADEVAEEAAEGVTEEKSELETELEEIRDMFQKELDAAREGTDSEMLIQELDEEAVAEEEDNLPKCECCGENPRALDYGEDYPYCESCRETMKRYPLRFSGVLALLVGIALFIGTTYFSFDVLESSISAADVVMNFESGKLMSALQSGYAYLSSTEQDVVSKKVVDYMIEGYSKTGYASDARSLIETFYTENQLKMPWNKKYQKCITEAEILEETYYAVSDVIEPVATGAEYDYDEIIAELDALKSMNPIEEGKSTIAEKYNEVFIEYYKYVVMNVNGESLENQLAQLKKLDEIGEGYEWVYLANLCGMAAKAGDEETVNDAFDRLIKINSEDTSAYVAKASYYRFLETPDADKILEICKEAEANAMSGDLSYKAYEAIAYLLKGEAELALAAIEEAINTSYTVQTCNLYALCGLAAGEDSAYNDMKAVLEGAGYEISDLVTQYKKGKLTIEEVLRDKGGDI